MWRSIMKVLLIMILTLILTGVFQRVEIILSEADKNYPTLANSMINYFDMMILCLY